jgi:hypothetical protein
MQKCCRGALAAIIALTAAFASRANPADPALAVAEPTYASSFAGYRRYESPQIAPWRELNDEMERLGGHAGHIKDDVSPLDTPKPDVQLGEPPRAVPPAPAPSAPKPAASGHKH